MIHQLISKIILGTTLSLMVGLGIAGATNKDTGPLTVDQIAY